MTIETQFNGIRDVTVITADEGKVFRRKDSKEIWGNQIALGYVYYMNGKKLKEPHLDTPEDFEEIFEDPEISPEEALQILMGE